jgi:malate dehydrogenase
VVIITAGLPRMPGMSRDDLLAANAKIMDICASNAAKHSPDAILVIVSNPLDAMVYEMQRITGFPPKRENCGRFSSGRA